jgi:hypothetical protein
MYYGSNGKTTTSSLIYYLLKNAGLNVGLAGMWVRVSHTRLLHKTKIYMFWNSAVSNWMVCTILRQILLSCSIYTGSSGQVSLRSEGIRESQVQDHTKHG